MGGKSIREQTQTHSIKQVCEVVSLTKITAPLLRENPWWINSIAVLLILMFFSMYQVSLLLLDISVIILDFHYFSFFQMQLVSRVDIQTVTHGHSRRKKRKLVEKHHDLDDITCKGMYPRSYKWHILCHVCLIT